MGLVNPKDKFYSRSNELLEGIMARKFGQAYTSTYVMLEASTLAANRTHNNATILAQIRSLFLGDLQIAPRRRINRHKMVGGIGLQSRDLRERALLRLL